MLRQLRTFAFCVGLRNTFQASSQIQLMSKTIAEILNRKSFDNVYIVMSTSEENIFLLYNTNIYKNILNGL